MNMLRGSSGDGQQSGLLDATPVQNHQPGQLALFAIRSG